MHVYNKIGEAIKENDSISFSVFGQFHHNFKEYYLNHSPKLLKQIGEVDFAPPNNTEKSNDILKVRSKIIDRCFQDSKILKRPIDKVIMYFNMPEFLIALNYIPSRIFPPNPERTAGKAA